MNNYLYLDKKCYLLSISTRLLSIEEIEKKDKELDKLILYVLEHKGNLKNIQE